MAKFFTIEPQSYYQLYQRVKKDVTELFGQNSSVTGTENPLEPTTLNKPSFMSLEVYTECVCGMLFSTTTKTHKYTEDNNNPQVMLTDLRSNLFVLENKANYPFQTAISPIIFPEENNEPQYMYMLALMLDKSYIELFVANLFLKAQNPYMILINALRYFKQELEFLSASMKNLRPDQLNSSVIAEKRNEIINKYLDTVKIIEKYDYKKLYPKTVPDRYTRMIELKELKNKSKWAMLVNPFELAAYNYMTYSPPFISSETHVSCDSITCNTEKLKIGAKVVSNKETFAKRMNEFCFGILENPPNTKLLIEERFPFGNVIFAGGCVTHLIESEMNALPNSDLDIFVYGDNYDQCLKAFNRIISWFDTPSTYYAIKGECVVNIYLKDVSRIFQIINTNAKHPYDIISNFDTSNVYWLAFYYENDGCYPTAFQNDLVYMTSDVENKRRIEILHELTAEKDVKKNQLQQSTKLANIHQLVPDTWHVFGAACSIESIRTRVAKPMELKKSSIERLMKTLYKGYHIEKTPELTNAFENLYTIVTNPNDVKGYIFDFNAHFYIKSSNLQEYTDENKKNLYIEGMISKFAKTDNITNSPEYVMKKTTIYVNFTTDYISISFTNFSVTQLRHSRMPMPRELDTGIVMRKLGGPLNIMSPYMRVLQIVYGENKTEIEFEITKEFREFINVVENNGIAIYAKEGKIQSIITERNSIFVILDNEVIDNKQKSNIFILRNDRGEQLNIYEDVAVNDIVKMLFRINVFKRDNTRSIKFDALKLIKQVLENEPLILEKFESKTEEKKLLQPQQSPEHNADSIQTYKNLLV